MATRRMQGRAITFAEWLAASKFKGSSTEFARVHGFPRQTVQHWVKGRGIGARYTQRLRDITGITEFATSASDKALYPRERAEAERHAKRIAELVDALGRELVYFRDKSPRHREHLRERMELGDVHHIANLLLLFTDEERYAEYRELNRTFRRMGKR